MGRRIRDALTAAGLSCGLLVAVAAPALAVAPGGPAPGKPDFDARAGDRAAVPAATDDARAQLAKRLGPEATVAADPVTGGLRSVARTDGFLTGPSSADPEAVALDYVRAHADAFGLDAADLAGLRPAERSTSSDGVTHLVFRQVDDGVAAYDSALTANVAADGRLVNAGGAPVHDLAAPGTDPPLGPGAARAAAQRDVGVAPDGDPGTTAADAARTTTFASGDRARLVTLADPDGDHLAWKLTVAGEAPYVYEVLVDAATGAILTRHSLTDFLASSATVVEHHPGDGTLHPVDLGRWLSGAPSQGLSGPNVHAYPDRHLPDGIGGDGEISPSSGTDFSYTTTGQPAAGGQHCPTAFTFVCTWDGSSLLSSSASVNVAQVTTQVFYYANRYHDWLSQPPIDFTAGSFNFEGADPVDAETDDYSGSSNASMSTPGDGDSPTLQMELFDAPNPAVNGGDDATVVYHEYTHGLTNRLVGGDGEANGLLARQSQAMGEGWSDWYALDFLTEQGRITDGDGPGDEVVGAYVTDDTATGIRNNAVDCRVGDTSSPHCPGTALAGPGGFTFGDMGRVASAGAQNPMFEVHDDGEIWAETLWDLRRAVGGAAARGLVTEALRLSPKQPSFLDMRDAILAADTVAGGAHRVQIWKVFAGRGMGYSATTTSANSTHAVEAFDTPPIAAAGAPDVAALPLEQDTVVHVPIRNPGAAALTGVRVTLAPAAGGVAVPQDSAALGTIAAGAAATAAFTVRVAADAGCGAVAATTLTIASDQGTQTVPVSLPVGSGRSGAVTHPYAPAAAIPDGNGAGGLTWTLAVPTHGRVGALRVTLAATHSWIGDLHVWLTSPAGTTVDLMERPGVDTATYFSRSDLSAASPLVFDDDATALIQELPGADTVIAGAWRPNQPLARFAGEDRYGTWTLHVTDAVAGDVGTLASWSLQAGDPACAITDAPTGLTSGSATFHARLDPGTTTATTSAFELGATTAYGKRSTPTTLRSGGGLQGLTASTSGLTPGATYHVRTVALRDGVVVAAGADRAFVAGSDTSTGTARGGGSTGNGGDDDGSDRHPSAPVERAPSAPATLTVPKATMRGLARTVRLDRKGRFALSLRATPARARGAITVRAGTASAGSKTFTVPANGRVKLTITATRKLRALLRHRSSVKTKVTIRIGVTSFTATLTIKPYKKPAKRR